MVLQQESVVQGTSLMHPVHVAGVYKGVIQRKDKHVPEKFKEYTMIACRSSTSVTRADPKYSILANANEPTEGAQVERNAVPCRVKCAVTCNAAACHERAVAAR